MTLTEERCGTPTIPHLDSTFSGTYAPLCQNRTHQNCGNRPRWGSPFYQRCSLGEDLSPDESRDATFMLTGAGTWVGKPAYLAAEHLAIQEGWWEIAQAITKHQIKVRGPRHPQMNLSTPQPFRCDWWRDSPQKETPGDANSYHELLPCWPLRGQSHNRHGRDGRSYHLSPHCCPQIMGLKAIEVWCLWPHQCHHCQTDQKAPGISTEVDDMGKLELTWKLIYPSLKMRTPRMLWPTKVGCGIWLYTIVQDAEIIHSFCTPFSPCKVTPEN